MKTSEGPGSEERNANCLRGYSAISPLTGTQFSQDQMSKGIQPLFPAGISSGPIALTAKVLTDIHLRSTFLSTVLHYNIVKSK